METGGTLIIAVPSPLNVEEGITILFYTIKLARPELKIKGSNLIYVIAFRLKENVYIYICICSRLYINLNLLAAFLYKPKV